MTKKEWTLFIMECYEDLLIDLKKNCKNQIVYYERKIDNTWEKGREQWKRNTY